MSESHAGANAVATLGSDLLAALAASFGWALIVALRLRASSPSGWTLLAAFGSSAFTLGIARAIRCRARPLSEGARCVVLGALLSSAVLSVIGAALRAKTHHRALGAVTFAIVAAVVVLVSVAIVARLREIARSRRAWRRLSTAMSVAIVVAAVGPMALSLSGSASPLVGSLVGDGSAGACLMVVTLVLPRWRLPAWAARASGLAWGTVVLAGLLVLGSHPPVHDALAARAPVALGIAAFGIP